MKERQDDQKERLEDVVPLALKIEEGAPRKGMQEAFNSWKGEEWTLSKSLQKECRPANTLILAQRDSF